jgi:O-antigen/teichoic acid export membrane protein
MIPSHRLAILRNLTWTMPAGMVEAVVKAVAVVLLARLLGPTEFGLVVLVLAVVAILGLLADAGISAATARRLSEAPGSARSTLRASAALLGTLLAIVGGAVVVGTGRLAVILGAPRLEELSWLLALLLVATVGRKFVAKFFEGMGRADLASKVAVTVGWAPWLAALAPVMVVAPRADLALTGYATASLVILTVLAVLLGLTLRADRGTERERTSRRQILGYALPMAATAAGFLVYTQADVILVQYFLSTDQVGVYGTAVRLLDLLHVPAAAVGASVAVYFVRLRREGPDHRAGPLFERVTRGLLAVYLPVGVGLLLFGRDLVGLIFGPGYLAAGTIVAIYVPFLLLKALAGTNSLALDYLGFATRRAVLVSLSALANVALNLWLIPRYGIVGAAVATQLSYTPLGVYYIWLLGRETGGRALSARTVRLGVAALVSGGLTFGLSRWIEANGLRGMVVFGVVYGAMAFAGGTVSREEWRTLLARGPEESRRARL